MIISADGAAATAAVQHWHILRVVAQRVVRTIYAAVTVSIERLKRTINMFISSNFIPSMLG